ncbi:hypothetical protein ACTXJY_10255 [Corynebacterium casei]|uniref:hypothetical protein n=2 Tax=Corynebacterium casei TaxID=160386 RepID=UPI003FD09842
MSNDQRLVAQNCRNIRQGDVVDLPKLYFPEVTIGDFKKLPTPSGVAIVSQTCDVVQPSKQFCLVAPILHNPKNDFVKNAAKGRRPLHLLLEDSCGTKRVADLEMVTSVPKVWLEDLPISASVPGGPSDKPAREVSAKIMRAYGRFPLPDEVVPGFDKFKKKVWGSSGKSGNFGKVLDLITDIRVAADQWENPGRKMEIYLLVEQDLMPPSEDLDPLWKSNGDHCTGARTAGESSNLTLDQVCKQILENLESNAELLDELWRSFAEVVEEQLLDGIDKKEVRHCEVIVLSEVDMTYELYKTTESFDFETLSHSHELGP